MPLTSPALDEPLEVNTDVARVHTALTRICETHREVTLAELAGDDDAALNAERRRSGRSQFQLPVLLIPVDWSDDDDQTVIVCGPVQVGVTRDISPTGLGLTHDQLLGSEAAIVQFDLPDEGPLNLILDLRWSVRKSRFSYMSGGRVAGMVESMP